MAKGIESTIAGLNKTKIYCAYARISQEGGYDKSQKDQMSILKSIAKKENLKIEEFEDVGSGYTGKKRENFETMIDLLVQDSKKPVHQRKYGGIIVLKLDRLSRSSKLTHIIEMLILKGYKIVSLTEQFDNTPTGLLLFHILSALASFESDKLSSRMTLSRINSILSKNYKSLGGKATFGYCYKGKDNFPSVDKKQAEIINRVYDLKIKRLSHREIVIEINKEFPNFISNYILGNKDFKEEVGISQKDTVYKKEIKFIEYIIYNDRAIKYNGYIEYKNSIKDDIIKELIYKYYKDDVDLDIEMMGENEIDSEIICRYFNENLIIVNDIKFKKLRNLIKPLKAKKKESINGLFDNIVYISIGEESFRARTEIGSKGNISYKKDFKNTSRGLSEKKLETFIQNSSNFKKIFGIDLNFVEIENSRGVSLYKYIETNLAKSFTPIIKRLILKKNIYKGYLDDIEYRLNKSKIIIEQNAMIDERAEIQEEMKAIEDKIYEIENKQNKIIQSFFAMFNDDFFLKEDKLRRTGYQMFLDKILIEYKELNDRDYKIYIFFKKFIADILGQEKVKIV